MTVGLRSALLVGLMASLMSASCGDSGSDVSSAPSAVELDTSQLSTGGRLTVNFDPPFIAGSVFFLRLSGGSLYWLSPDRYGANSSFGEADPSNIEVTLEAIRHTSVVLSLPHIPDDESAELCFNEDFAFCVPLDVSDGELTVTRPGEGGSEPADAVLETHEQMRLGGLFGGELREYLGSQLGVIGWSDDGSEFVVRGVGLTPDQVSRISEDAQRLGVPVRVVAAALATSEQHQLIDLIREQVLHALPAEVGWSIGIDLDTQRIGVTVEGHADLADLDRVIRSVAEGFLKTLGLQRAATYAPAADVVDARDLYYVVGAEAALVDSQEN